MPNPFARALRRRRIELGLTQAEVAGPCGVTPEAVTLYEKGKRFPDLERVPRLAAVLELESDALGRLLLQEQAPLFYADLVGEELPKKEALAGENPENRVLVELDREDAAWVKQLRQMDSRTRLHLREIADRLAQSAARRRGAETAA